VRISLTRFRAGAFGRRDGDAERVLQTDRHRTGQNASTWWSPGPTAGASNSAIGPASASVRVG
jgi:hypothetical protein